jgi:heme oxygenase
MSPRLLTAPEPVEHAPDPIDTIRMRTHALHRQAERSGVLHDLLHGRGDRRDYAMLLRNLLPVYRALEHGLDHHRQSSMLRELCQQALFRSAALESDLDALCDRSWRESMEILPAADRYAACVTDASRGDGSLLIAHAYVRFLGDLNGGQFLRCALARSLSLHPSELGFFEFPGISDIAAFAADYRAALQRAARAAPDPDALTTEAESAFRLNIDLSTAVAAADL